MGNSDEGVRGASVGRSGALALALLAGAGPAPARAPATCRCGPQPPVAQALAGAGGVFEARIVPFRGDTRGVYTAVVVRSWKGPPAGERILLRTPRDFASCAYPFAPGERYLVF